MKGIFLSFLLALAVFGSAQAVVPPEGNSTTSKFLATSGLVFVTDAKDFGSFKVSESFFSNKSVSIKVTAVVVWDNATPASKHKAFRFRCSGFYDGFDLDLYADYDELGELQRFFTLFDKEAAEFKPSKDYWRRVQFRSRGGVSFALEAYDDKRDLRVAVFDRSIYMMSKDRERMKTIIDAAKKWLDEYPS